MGLTLVYCFTFKLTEPEILVKYKQKIIEILNTSITFSKRFHSVVLYTDYETLDSVKGLDVEIRLVNSKDFIFTDDFKLSLHPNLLPNEILIDFDVFLESELRIDSSKDLVLEKYEDPKYFYRYERTLNQLSSYKIIDDFTNLIISKDQMPNIGILKVYNESFWEKYIILYHHFRSTLLLQLTPEDNPIKYSAMLGQYTLNSLLLVEKPSLFICNKNNNSYLHINSYEKYLRPLNELIGPILPKRLI